MDEPPKPEAQSLKPAVPSQPPKHRMPRWLKILVWTVVGGVSLVCIYFAFGIVEIIIGISTIANRCQASQDKATAASEQYANALNSLDIFTQPYANAQASPSGDCIDTAAHTADATLSKIYQSSEPFELLSGQINSGLASNGYKLKSAPALQSIQEPTDPINVEATYSKPGLPDLTVTYTVGHNPNVCDQFTQADATQNSDAYNNCVSQYEASFSNLSAQSVSEVDLDMTRDFSNNY